MPATRTALADITPVATPGRRSLLALGQTTPPLRRQSGAPVIESTYIRPFDPEGHAVETATQAWSQYNRHLFRERRDDHSKPYPEIDTVYLCSNTWKASDDTFKDLFLDDM